MSQPNPITEQEKEFLAKVQANFPDPNWKMAYLFRYEQDSVCITGYRPGTSVRINGFTFNILANGFGDHIAMDIALNLQSSLKNSQFQNSWIKNKGSDFHYFPEPADFSSLIPNISKTQETEIEVVQRRPWTGIFLPCG